ncbi:MAG: hypothetical protein EOP88_17350 [Verrucomicrobiaceae bacterium]|nr:MAG: hypothetical protein EOP88_17350 [Verrucomicrobiaceae bacterium]
MTSGAVSRDSRSSPFPSRPPRSSEPSACWRSRAAAVLEKPTTRKPMKKQLALCLAAALPLQASIVSWNYDRNGTVTGTNVAGVSPVANWNNSWPSNPVTDLIDKDGIPTTLDLAYTSFNNWNIQASHPGVDGDGKYNKELLNGYLNAGPAPWNPAITSSSVALSQIPYPKYNVIIYFSSDAADREGTVTDGTTIYHFKSLGVASITGSNAILTQATDTTTTGYTVGANYAIFSGLTGVTKTFTVQMRDNDEWGGIAGFQVVADLGSVPEFALQPENQAAAVNSSATFTASAAADPAPTYQWQYSTNGTTGWAPLAGEASASLMLAGVTHTEEGYYRVVATNTNGSVPSNSAFLDVFYGQPRIEEQPQDAYVPQGSTVTLSVLAVGYDTLSYQWYKGAGALSGKTSETLVLTNVSNTDAGDYHVEITDSIEPGLKRNSDTASVFVFPAWNGLVSHDAFSVASGYTEGELPLQSPTVAGYQGAWTDVDFGDAETAILAGSLTYPDPLYAGSSGDKVGKAADAAGIATANSGRVYRKLAPALVAAATTTGTRYVSWLYRNGNENTVAQPHVHSVLSLYQDTGGANPAGDAARRVFQAGISDADFATTNYAFRFNDLQTGDLGVPVDANVHLFVAKFQFSPETGGDSITVWLNPALGSGEPAGGVTLTGLDVTYDSIAFSDYASNSVAWDELRWGSTFDSVTLGQSSGTGFNAWIAGYPTVGAKNGFTDDADNDGIPNGVENLFGSNPALSNAGITQVAKSGSTVTFQHPRNATPASDVTASYLWSTDLATFHASGAAAGGTTVTIAAQPDVPSAGISTVTATVTGTQPPRLFLRMRAVKVP